MRFLCVVLLLTLAIPILDGCQSVDEHAAAVQRAQSSTDRLTLGTIQQQIRVGMTSAQVAEILGAPNMVTTDDQRREVWVYDKIATQTAASASAGGLGLLIVGVGSSAGVESTSQRTLTVIIKFDDTGHVRDYSYRSSAF